MANGQQTDGALSRWRGALTPSTQTTPHHTLVLSCHRLQLHLECLGNYYHNRYGLDFRSLRFPGVLSASAPGGGTTDYVLDMYFEAHKYKQCTSFLSKDIEVRQSRNYLRGTR